MSQAMLASSIGGLAMTLQSILNCRTCIVASRTLSHWKDGGSTEVNPDDNHAYIYIICFNNMPCLGLILCRKASSSVKTAGFHGYSAIAIVLTEHAQLDGLFGV